MSEPVIQLHARLARRLIPIFFAWKAVLLLLAAFSPGPGYDTSSLISLNGDSNRHVDFQSMSRFDRLALKAFRWDALYFVKSAQRGYVYEQEWAFSWAYSYILNTAAQFLSGDAEPSLQRQIWAGIAISNVSHLISVLVLFRLLNVALGNKQSGQIPFIAAVLHVLSPAAIFLCSPYTESLFSAFNFTGMLHYALSRSTASSNQGWSISQAAFMLSSGFLFALATTMRGNGLLSGLIYLYDVASFLPRIFTMQLNKHEVRRLIATCVAGLLVAAGFIGPQYLAYREFCSTNSSLAVRPWCSRSIPSIYTWVQSTYWNVGFLRYWTLSNVPLFLIAAPMLWLLAESSVTTLRDRFQQPSIRPHVSQTAKLAGFTATDPRFCILPQLALPQLVLAIAATTSFHVQIINRLSSGYPIWYLVTAERFVAEREIGLQGTFSHWAIRGMIMYAIVQGMLYASFLPPA